MSGGTAVLIAGEVSSAPRLPLMRMFGQVQEALRAAEGDWQLRPFIPELGLPSHDPISDAGPLLVIVLGDIVTRDDEPAVVVAIAEDAVPATTLSLRAISAWSQAHAPDQLVMIVAGWATGDERGLAATWFDALTTRRASDLIAVAAGESAGPLLSACLEALTGGATDSATGTLTLRSLGELLVRRVPGAVVQRSGADKILLESPPLSGSSDPRLLRYSQLVTQMGPSGAPPEPDTLVGVVLPGRLRIDALVAQGGFGAVYRARQLNVGRDVAVKVLHSAAVTASSAGRLFIQEIQSVGRIDHPNVVRIYHADMTPSGQLFFAMELLAGRNLEEVLEAEGVLETSRAIAIMRQLLAGLGAAHDAGLVHADVKPANVLLVTRRDGERAVLVDFGLARLRSAEQPARSLGGTPAYMAPEQLHDGEVDARSDVFATALVLVTLLTGRRRRSMTELAPALDDIEAPALRAALSRALAVDPAARFPTAAAFAEAIEPVVVPSVQVVRPGSARRKLLALTLVAVVMAAWAVAGAPGHARPTVLIGGSGTVLYGLLEPRIAFLEQRSLTSLPIRSIFDVGSEGAMRSLRGGEIDLAALSTRYMRAEPASLAASGKVLLEVAVGFDETALFVRRDNPLRRIDVAAIRGHLCCGIGESMRSTIWSDLGLDAPPLGSHAVGWTVFGREHPPVPHDSTSATLLQADGWLCGARQLCASARNAADVSANTVLERAAADPDALVLSSRAFATDQVAPLVVVNSTDHTRLDGRKVLWLYAPVSFGAPLSTRICRVLDAVLDAGFVAQLVAVGRAQGLPDGLRRRQRAALGLEDDTCARLPILPGTASPDLARGVVRSAIADEVEITARWVDDR